jgi:hypothetical protein
LQLRAGGRTFQPVPTCRDAFEPGFLQPVEAKQVDGPAAVLRALVHDVKQRL